MQEQLLDASTGLNYRTVLIATTYAVSSSLPWFSSIGVETTTYTVAQNKSHTVYDGAGYPTHKIDNAFVTFVQYDTEVKARRKFNRLIKADKVL